MNNKMKKESKAQKMQREMAESLSSPYYKELVSNKIVRDAHWMRVNGEVVPPSIEEEVEEIRRKLRQKYGINKIDEE